MKKLTACILMFLFSFAFSGCSKKAPEKINMHINSSYSASMGDMELSGILIYSEDGEMYLEISTPDELSGLNFSFTDNFTMGYRGLSVVTETDYLPTSAFAQSIKNSLDNALMSKPMLEEAEDKKYTAIAKSDSGLYKIHTDELGNIKGIEIPGTDVVLSLQE